MLSFEVCKLRGIIIIWAFSSQTIKILLPQIKFVDKFDSFIVGYNYSASWSASWNAFPHSLRCSLSSSHFFIHSTLNYTCMPHICPFQPSWTRLTNYFIFSTWLRLCTWGLLQARTKLFPQNVHDTQSPKSPQDNTKSPFGRRLFHGATPSITHNPTTQSLLDKCFSCNKLTNGSRIFHGWLFDSNVVHWFRSDGSNSFFVLWLWHLLYSHCVHLLHIVHVIGLNPSCHFKTKRLTQEIWFMWRSHETHLWVGLPIVFLHSFNHDIPIYINTRWLIYVHDQCFKKISHNCVCRKKMQKKCVSNIWYKLLTWPSSILKDSLDKSFFSMNQFLKPWRNKHWRQETKRKKEKNHSLYYKMLHHGVTCRSV